MEVRRALFLLMVLFGAGRAVAQQSEGHHGIRHSVFHDWYMGLHDKKGISCCHDEDCRPTQSRIKDGATEVMVDGEWMPVPPDAILDKTPPDLGAHVCATRPVSPNKPHLNCVIIGKGV